VYVLGHRQYLSPCRPDGLAPEENIAAYCSQTKRRLTSSLLSSLSQSLTCRTAARQSTSQHFTKFTPRSFILPSKHIYQKDERGLPQFSQFQCVHTYLTTAPSCLDPKELTKSHITKSFELGHNATVGSCAYAWHKLDGASSFVSFTSTLCR
jgi:hypothetical protein